MRYILILVLLIAHPIVVTAGAQQQRASSESPIDLPPPLARVLRDYETAWHGRDAAALARLFVDNEIVMPNACAPVRGRAGVERCYAKSGGDLALRALAYGTDGRLGYIIGEYADREGEPAAGRFTLTLRQDPSGRWMIVSDMDRGYPRPR